MELYERFKNNLGKLQRNENQMSEEQKEKYAAPLKKLKGEIKSDAIKVMWSFATGGCRKAKDDGESEAWKTANKKTEEVMKEWSSSGKIKKAFEVLFQTYDIEMWLVALLPLHYKIWYEAYGPYWLSHCIPTFESEYTFTNDIIGMEWWAEHNEWAAVKVEDGKKVTDYEKGVTIMLPPTREPLDKAYKEDMETLIS